MPLQYDAGFLFSLFFFFPKLGVKEGPCCTPHANPSPPFPAIPILSLSLPFYPFFSFPILLFLPSLWSLLPFFTNPFCSFFNPGFLPLHHHLSAFSPFSSQPDRS